MAGIAKTGLTPKSLDNMVFGAGAIYKNFTYGEHYKRTFDKTPQTGKSYYTIVGGPSGGTSYSKWDGEAFGSGTYDIYYEKYTGYGGDLIGATQGGTKVSIVPEYTDIEVDGILVKMKGLTRKIGEKATMETQVLDLLGENTRLALNGKIVYTGENMAGGSNSTFCQTKSDISDTDYITNLALVAPQIETGKIAIVIFKKALCTSGFEIDTKNKEAAVNKYTFEAYAEMSDENVDTLPVQVILDPKL